MWRFTVPSRFYFFNKTEQDLFPIMVTCKHHGDGCTSVMIYCTLVSLLKSKITHLILILKRERHGVRKPLTLGDTALH